ncbi:hypothetical protein CAL29_22970 [Bordetella genomosp. 10]|uniref:Uncharacterized protein n=1 Tax=Bordetella genomosp. 10 TaxID=1416804 RepID=A0A261S0G2_9BORD|nr:hypothetical protein CAL29_22970 [Bordetella genomosp. 10]
MFFPVAFPSNLFFNILGDQRLQPLAELASQLSAWDGRRRISLDLHIQKKVRRVQVVDRVKHLFLSLFGREFSRAESAGYCCLQVKGIARIGPNPEVRALAVAARYVRMHIYRPS